MTRIRISSFGQHPGFSRALSLLLLVFVVYGTTIAAAHRHGKIFDADPSSLTASVSQPNGTSTLNGGPIGCNECVLCQLHQYSSTALIPIRTGITELNTRSELPDPGSIVINSIANRPQKGRAPPFTS